MPALNSTPAGSATACRPTWLAFALLALALWLPFVWLGTTVDGFGHARMLRSLLFVLTLTGALLLLCRASGRPGAWLAWPIYCAVLLLSLAEAISWFMQGSSFNERFFAHLDTNNLIVSVHAYPWAALAVLCALLSFALLAWHALRTFARRRLPRWVLLPALALLALSLLLDGPPRHLRQYAEHSAALRLEAASDAGAAVRALITPEPSTPAQVRALPGRNLVFIYLESLERSYTDTTRFPGLVPNINRLRRQGLDFSQLWTFPGVTYTIAGIFTSQCGAPFLLDSTFGHDINALGFVPGNDNTDRNTFHPQLACLGDVLHAAGYRQTYLSGVDLGFANTELFFRLHGYDDIRGASAIQRTHHGQLKTEGWGLKDDDLFKQALDSWHQGEASGRPFSVVLSTIDTHPPEGYRLASCTPYTAINNAMLDAVHCSDQLLGRFIDTLSQQPGWSNTVVVVMSDHVAMRNVASDLYPPDDQRQPLLFILNAGHGERTAHMFHMDIAPTVLAALGVRSNVRFLAGADRGEADSPASRLPVNELAVAVLRQALWKQQTPPRLCQGGDLLHWQDRGIEAGGWPLPLMDGGFPASSLRDDLVLQLYIDGHTAQLQSLAAGNDGTWAAKALSMGRDVFQFTPYWSARGRRIAVDWRAPGGGWASLGSFDRLADVKLASPRCAALRRQLATAPAGTRLDLASAFGGEPLSATDNPAPGVVRPLDVPANASTTANARIVLARVLDQQVGAGPPHLSYHDRLTLYPSMNKSAWLEIDLAGIDEISLQPRINTLLGKCLTRSDTGIVGFTAQVDGKARVPHTLIDRHSQPRYDLRTHGAKTLRVEFDKGNAIMDCDWSVLVIPRIQPAPAVSTDLAATKPNQTAPRNARKAARAPTPGA